MGLVERTQNWPRTGRQYENLDRQADPQRIRSGPTETKN